MKGLLTNFLKRRRLEKVAPYLKGKILDLGCGDGGIIDYLSDQEYFGVDITKNTISNLSKKFPRLKFVQADLNKEQVKIKIPVDTVLMVAVIEHLKTPNNLFGYLKNYMKKDASLIITTPSKFGDKIHQFGAKLRLFSTDAVKQHEKIYSFDEMKELLNTNGFVLKDFSKFEFGLNQFFLAKLSG